MKNYIHSVNEEKFKIEMQKFQKVDQRYVRSSTLQGKLSKDMDASEQFSAMQKMQAEMQRGKDG